MTSSHRGTSLQLNSDCHRSLCTATNTGILGFAVCSLPQNTHATHQLRCEGTGELLGEWTDADTAFRQPLTEPHYEVEFSHVA